MQNNQLALIAVVAALSMLGIVVLTVTVTIPLQQQQAEAATPPTKGCRNSLAANASQGNCVRG